MPRAVGIIRVSNTKGREGESFHSPSTQRERITDECKRQGLDLIEVHEEMDVSGGSALEKRPGLYRAVLAIEAGDADVIMTAYLDRLTRSVRIREEVVDRVEAAGGTVFTVDMGLQTNGTAGAWLTGTLSSAVGEYMRRTSAERSALAQQRAIDRGITPFPNIPPGYRRPVVGRSSNGAAIHGALVPHPVEAEVVGAAFILRMEGATIDEVRKFLGKHGIKRSYRGAQSLLGSRVLLGEIHFGNYNPNLSAHPPIVDRGVWEQVQKVTLPRGPRPSSDRLLARLGVLRCGSCNARMVVGTAGRASRYPFYRCPPTGDCSRRVTISAVKVEAVVVDEVRRILADVEGSASAEAHAHQAAVELERAQANLNAAIRAFAEVGDEPAARERLAELRGLRDAAQVHLDQLGGLHAAVTIKAGADWDRLSLDARRALIRATIERVRIAPGRGDGRITVEAFGK